MVLLVGGNQGDKAAILSEAVNMIGQAVGQIQSVSQMYESPAWGFDSENDFLNQAVLIKTDLGPRAVLKEVLNIELELGRKRSGVGYSDRTIDIDILCWEEKIFWTSTLQVPHVRLHERAFALAPLTELLPEWRHPLLEQTSSQLLEQLEDTGDVRPVILFADE